MTGCCRLTIAGQVVDRIPVGRGPGGVAVGDGEVWVANQLDGTVSEVNPAAGTVVATIGVGNGPDAIAFGYRSVWVANVTDGTLSRIDPGSGHVLATIPLGGTPAGLAAGERGIWVTSPDTGRLLLVDPHANRVSRAFPVGVSPGGVAVGAGSVWVSDPGGAVARVDPVTGRVRKIRAGGSPAGIAYADGAVWVADSQGGSVWRIDPQTGSVRSIHVGNEPAALAPAGGGVLVTVLPSLASHRGGTLTLIAQLSPHDQATDPAAAYIDSHVADAERDQRRAGRLPAHRRAGRRHPRPRPCDSTTRAGQRAARPTSSTSAPASGTPTGHRSGRKTSVARSSAVFAINAGPAAYYTGIIGADQCERTPGHCDLARGIVTNDQADTVTFHLTAPDPEFLYKLAFPFADAVPPERLITRSDRPSSPQPAPT